VVERSHIEPPHVRHRPTSGASNKAELNLPGRSDTDLAAEARTACSRARLSSRLCFRAWTVTDQTPTEPRVQNERLHKRFFQTSGPETEPEAEGAILIRDRANLSLLQLRLTLVIREL
jgi:hypothetical protein